MLNIVLNCIRQESAYKWYRNTVKDPSSIFSSKSVERGWWNINRRGFIDRQRKGVGVGEEENIFFLALHARSRTLASLEDVFEKNEKKNKITSVHRLDCYFNQHYQHRTNQKLRSCANAVLQNRGVCGQAFPCLPPSPVIPLFFALVPFLSTNSRGNAFYTGSALRNKGRPRAVYFFTCENNMTFSEIFTCKDIMFSRESSPGISLVFM